MWRTPLFLCSIYFLHFLFHCRGSRSDNRSKIPRKGRHSDCRRYRWKMTPSYSSPWRRLEPLISKSASDFSRVFIFAFAPTMTLTLYLIIASHFFSFSLSGWFSCLSYFSSNCWFQHGLYYSKSFGSSLLYCHCVSLTNRQGHVLGIRSPRRFDVTNPQWCKVRLFLHSLGTFLFWKVFCSTYFSQTPSSRRRWGLLFLSRHEDCFSCRVTLRSLAAVVKTRRHVESLRLYSEISNDAHFLTFEFTICKTGMFTVVHRIPVAQDANRILATMPKEGASEIIASPRVLLKMLEPLYKKSPEVAFIINNVYKVSKCVFFYCLVDAL